LLDGLYYPNLECKIDDNTKAANDFVKENKNHQCENFTISDIYDVQMKEVNHRKQLDQEAKLMALLKPQSIESIEEKLHMSNVIKINAIRNMKAIDPKTLVAQ